MLTTLRTTNESVLRALLSAGLIAVSPVHGHHAYSVNYDTDSVLTIEGVVEEVLWTNPHVHYYMTVTNDDGSKELWDIETHNLSALTRSGWTRNSIRAGERVKVTGNPGRSGIRRISGSRFEKEDGTVLVAFGRPSSSDRP